MARACSICSHKQVSVINRELISGRSLREIAENYKVSKDALSRHRDHVAAAEKEEIEQESVRLGVARNLLDRMDELREATEEILRQALDKTNGNPDTALKAIARLEKQVEIVGKLKGAFQQDKENEADIERKRVQYPRAIERIIEQCKQQGIEISRREAIEALKGYKEFQDITLYVEDSS